MTARVPIAFGLLVVLAAAVSGPLVGGVDVTRATNSGQAGTATADATVVSVPTDEYRFEMTSFGAGRYALAAPVAVVRVSDVRGTPLLRYSIDVPGLSLTVTSRYELDRVEGGTVRLKHRPIGISPDRVDRDRYEATVAVWLSSGDRYSRVFERRVTVEVRG